MQVRVRESGSLLSARAKICSSFCSEQQYGWFEPWWAGSVSKNRRPPNKENDFAARNPPPPAAAARMVLHISMDIVSGERRRHALLGFP